MFYINNALISVSGDGFYEIVIIHFGEFQAPHA